MWLGAVLALAACGGSTPTAAPSARARVYTSSKACLLTDARGINAAPASQVWAGMEDASLKTRAQVSYLAVTGSATSANALTYVGSLVVEQCGVVVASGPPEQAAVLAEAPKFPGVRFVLAGAGVQDPVAGGNGNVVVASPGRSGLRGAVAALIEADTGG
jgi:basic membrane lipoprotein Med (substrate-binding protein (PBP1-ABC) superfamily)